jgi:hypothetical protein
MNMGTYIYSLGHVGLWEDVRPLIWPMIVGFFWKIGFDELLWAKIVTILFSIGTLLLTYITGCKYFNKNTGIVAALFLACSPLFFLYTSVLQTEIPATFFFLLGLMAGSFAGSIWIGISFLTRFFQGFLILPFIVYSIIKKQFCSFCFLIPILFFLAINYVLYENPFTPFIRQAYMTLHTGWIFHQPGYYYFTELFKENYLWIFAFAGIYFAVKKKEYLIPFLLLCGFAPFAFAAHKELRILLPLLPFLFMLTAYGLLELFSWKYAALFLAIWFVVTVPQLHFNTYDDHLDFFYTANVSEKAWISNPSFIINKNVLAEPLYYPLYNSEKIQELLAKRHEAKTILLNSCDVLPCPDDACIADHALFLETLKKEFAVRTLAYKNCDYYIFQSLE